jgi:hypothetical protein
MKTYWGTGGIAPHIVNVCTRWTQVVSFMPWILYLQGRNLPQYPFYRRLGGLQSQSGQSGKKKNPISFWELNPGWHYVSRFWYV